MRRQKIDEATRRKKQCENMHSGRRFEMVIDNGGEHAGDSIGDTLSPSHQGISPISIITMVGSVYTVRYIVNTEY